jgi:hypothetical protein
MSVTLHTSHGDIKVEIYCESVPKTAEVRKMLLYSSLKLLTNQLSELSRSLRLRLLRSITIPPSYPQIHGPDRCARNTQPP